MNWLNWSDLSSRYDIAVVGRPLLEMLRRTGDRTA